MLAVEKWFQLNYSPDCPMYYSGKKRNTGIFFIILIIVSLILIVYICNLIWKSKIHDYAIMIVTGEEVSFLVLWLIEKQRIKPEIKHTYCS
jgi:hypothetical protein